MGYYSIKAAVQPAEMRLQLRIQTPLDTEACNVELVPENRHFILGIRLHGREGGVIPPRQRPPGLGGLNHRQLFLTAQKSNKVWAGLVSPEAFLCGLHVAAFSLRLHVAFPCVCASPLSLCVSKSPLRIRTLVRLDWDPP